MGNRGRRFKMIQSLGTWYDMGDCGNYMLKVIRGQGFNQTGVNSRRKLGLFLPGHFRVLRWGMLHRGGQKTTNQTAELPPKTGNRPLGKKQGEKGKTRASRVVQREITLKWGGGFREWGAGGRISPKKISKNRGGGASIRGGRRCF